MSVGTRYYFDYVFIIYWDRPGMQVHFYFFFFSFSSLPLPLHRIPVTIMSLSYCTSKTVLYQCPPLPSIPVACKSFPSSRPLPSCLTSSLPILTLYHFSLFLLFILEVLSLCCWIYTFKRTVFETCHTTAAEIVPHLVLYVAQFASSKACFFHLFFDSLV
jgi:hypothetical protein